ncbi:MAG: NADH-quinone oxidoreductase subunit NuoF [Candidatus Omnitrophica bacterium]|nr:NADH-quinone oxidoreductase subunit NuoF [Candidatus Omnitrophota bacterium]
MEPILSRNFNVKDAWTLPVAESRGAYQTARKVLTSMKPEDVTAAVVASNLRGLGGAGFPTGKKWQFLPKDSPKPVYLVVNADEGEPGTFKDRYILERDPHQLIEGILISAFAIKSRKAYVYVRGEYAEPYRRLQSALDEAAAKNYLGKNIFGTGFNLEIVAHRGAGAYICGEETALLNSLEGGKGYPRLKPPFPAVVGLFGCPTIINNVETLACVPPILKNGAGWFAGLGSPGNGGTRLFSVSGHVKKPGVYELPMGTPLREIIYAHAGGLRGGRALKAVIPGGISAKILTANEIDVKMDYDSLKAAGTMLGSAGVIVMDDTASIVKALYYAAKFFAHESCGQCSPCREGTGWAYKIVRRIYRGEGSLKDLDTLLALAKNMEGRTICVFADAAAWPIQSYITKFRKEFEEHINNKHEARISKFETISKF